MSTEPLGVAIAPGVYMNCRRRPGAQPVLFIHGIAGSAVYMTNAFDAPDLKEYDLLAPDLLGYGQSSTPAAFDYSLVRQAEALKLLLDLLHLERVVVVGHSVGGTIAVLLAGLFPQRVAALILAEANLTLADATWSGRVCQMSPADFGAELQALRANPDAMLAHFSMQDTPENRRLLQYLFQISSPTAIHRTALSVVHITGQPAFLEQVARLPVPIHMLVGKRSRAWWQAPAPLQNRFHDVHVIPQAGHMMMLDNPDAFYNTVARIIRRI